MTEYRKYKDSGIAWASEIPVSWNIRHGKWVLNLMQRAVRDDDEVVTCFRDGEVILRTLRRTDDFTMSDKEIGYQGVNIGDIVIHGMDGFAGAMGISKSQGKSTPVYVVCTTKNNHNERYIIYYLRSLAHNDVFLSLSTGIRERSCDLKWNKISVLPFILPDHSEQRAIADFLDVKCAEVDELIALQEKMIDELKVYKQSVITEAVTKGLNPDAPLKDSGIEWIGQIPEHWEVRRLKNIGSAQNGLTYSPIDVCDENQGILVLRSSNIQDGKLAFDDNVYVYVNKVPNNLLVCKGDIIICSRNGSASLVGKSALVTDDISACFGAFMMRFRSNEDYRYTYNLLTAAITQYKQLFSTSTINQLTIGIFSGLAMPFTRNKEEQQQIADYLDTKCAEIDEMTSIKQQKIEQLKEYKKSIIYEYVTGKKQVNIE